MVRRGFKIAVIGGEQPQPQEQNPGTTRGECERSGDGKNPRRKSETGRLTCSSHYHD